MAGRTQEFKLHPHHRDRGPAWAGPRVLGDLTQAVPPLQCHLYRDLTESLRGLRRSSRSFGGFKFQVSELYKSAREPGPHGDTGAVDPTRKDKIARDGPDVFFKTPRVGTSEIGQKKNVLCLGRPWTNPSSIACKMRRNFEFDSGRLAICSY